MMIRLSFILLFFIVLLISSSYILFFFFFNDTATTEIYTLSLHDALPISNPMLRISDIRALATIARDAGALLAVDNSILSPDRKSTRLNSSHLVISYAVFCLKKKKKHSTV